MVLMVIVGRGAADRLRQRGEPFAGRSAARQREIAIRMALGSGRGRLIRQLLTESLVLSLTGAALGVLFAQWGTRVSGGIPVRWAGSKVFLDLSIDSRVLAFTAGVAILTGLLFGLAPAWRGTRVNPQSAMKANARGVIEGSKFGLGKALVVIAGGAVAAAGGGRGIDADDVFPAGNHWTPVLSASIFFWPASICATGIIRRSGASAAYREMLERLRALPGVRSASDSRYDSDQRRSSGMRIWRSKATRPRDAKIRWFTSTR